MMSVCVGANGHLLKWPCGLSWWVAAWPWQSQRAGSSGAPAAAMVPAMVPWVHVQPQAIRTSSVSSQPFSSPQGPQRSGNLILKIPTS